MVPGIGGGGTEVSAAPAAGRGAPRAALASASARRIAPRACVSGGSSTGPRRPQAPRLAATSASARTAKGRRVRSGNGGVTAIRPRGEPAHYSDEAKKGEGAGVTKIGFFAGERKSGTRIETPPRVRARALLFQRNGRGANDSRRRDHTSAGLDAALQRAKLTEKAQKPGHPSVRLYDLASACLGRAWPVFSDYSRRLPRLFS